MTLSVSQMALMNRLLEEALPLDEAARRLWLERLSPAYRDLAPALSRSLLPDEAQAARVEALASLPKFGAAASNDAAADSGGFKAGSRVGPYELLRRLGAGGMAEVWLARRADGALKRDVALKLPLLALARADIEQRFIRERDIVASLEHVNIARLYDAGVADGSPYLSMEYVQGLALTDWCSSRRLGIAQRLELFLQVLEAVRYAHDKQVLHRDLKPSNILVMEPGQVRLLDFGVAKLLEASDSDVTQLTRVHGRALTPDYASPELLRGDSVDVRSDIYSLGVLLYELLTGKRPYRLKSAASMGMLEHAIATLEVKKPSTLLEEDAAAAATRVEGVGLTAGELRGDLDAVTLKALARDPALRYASVADLAADVRRYLKHEPVQARLGGALYRARKFAARNRAATALGVAAAAVLLGVGGYLLRERLVQGEARPAQARPAEALPLQARPEDMPDAARSTQPSVRAASSVPAAADSSAAFAPPDHSIAVLPFLDASEAHDQEYFSEGLAEELLDQLAKIASLHVVARTSSFSFKGKSDDTISIARKLNVANILEGSVRKSGDRVRVTAQLVRAVDGENIWSETYDRQLKDVFQVQDEIAGAVVAALKIKLASGPPAASAHRTANIDAYNEVLIGRQFFDRFTLEGFKRAAEAYRKATQLDPGYAAAYAELAMSEFFAANWSGDKAGEQRALAAADRAVALAPDESAGYAARGHIRTNGPRDFAGARADFEKALAIDPSDSMALRRYGLLMGTLGRLPEAIAMTRRAIDLDPISSVTWSNLGLLLLGNGQMSAAHDAIHRALEIQPDSSYALDELIALQLQEGNPQGAIETVRRRGGEESLLRVTAMAEYSLHHAREAQRALTQLAAKCAKQCAYDVAVVHAWRGDIPKTFEWLERARQNDDNGLVNIEYEPTFTALRDDARYKKLLSELKLPVP